MLGVVFARRCSASSSSRWPGATGVLAALLPLALPLARMKAPERLQVNEALTVAVGARVGKKRAYRAVRHHGVQARGKKNFVVTTDSCHDLPIANNVQARNFTPQTPNLVWTSDITYIAIDEGWLFLTAVLNLSSRRCRAEGIAGITRPPKASGDG